MSLDLPQRGHYIARIPRPTLCKPGWVQQGLETGQVTSGSGSGVILATYDKRVLPAVVASESAPDVIMGPLMPGCRRSLLPFAHPPPAVASFTPPHKHQETFNSPRSCLQYLISHLSQAEYLQLREAKVYPNSDHHYDALLLRIVCRWLHTCGSSQNLSLSTHCQVSRRLFLIHFSRTCGKCWCKLVVLVAMGLTLFPRHEVRDLLARVHPFQRWLHRQNLPFSRAARSLYSHIPSIPRATCRE